jgi:predicted membrane protein
VPLGLLGTVQILKHRLPAKLLQRIYLASSLLILAGVFAMRWNVVIGGQLFSKSLRGFTTYKLEFIGNESVFTAMALMVLPLVILGPLLYFFLPRFKTAAAQIINPTPS